MKYSGESVAILFSGGTDSTLTAALLEKSFEKIHLVTYNRFGFHATDNTAVQAKMLKDKFGAERFVHDILNVDKLFKHISYERYVKNIKEFGFFNLSTCGLCKLSMHVRTIIYCKDNDIKYVADGANQAMSMFPAQMEGVIDELKKMYEHFGIVYFNPVFEMDGHEDKGFIEKANLQLLNDPTIPEIEKINLPVRDKKTETPGDKLFKLGLAPNPNVKGSKYDRKRQPRCFQFIIFNIFAIKYYLQKNTYEEYRDKTVSFYKHKIGGMIDLIEKKDDKKVRRLFEE
ncbi:hypothetical protein A9Q84_19910 [Halobacteriovorax marinus]|uniref:Thil AANH domain-containing protein n=1 Tax=Halobacteriovorax marinus TaxID=97084 RepID=A0A1Y5F988_9BACT|nr:hypothetical protein A9Q84_19910 [Halobacteriovorax marinus]